MRLRISIKGCVGPSVRRSSVFLITEIGQKCSETSCNWLEWIHSFIQKHRCSARTYWFYFFFPLLYLSIIFFISTPFLSVSPAFLIFTPTLSSFPFLDSSSYLYTRALVRQSVGKQFLISEFRQKSLYKTSPIPQYSPPQPPLPPPVPPPPQPWIWTRCCSTCSFLLHFYFIRLHSHPIFLFLLHYNWIQNMYHVI